MTERSKILPSVRQLSSDEFESLVASIWSNMGWSTQVTSSSHDNGIDVIATKAGVVNEKVVIQAKRYAEGNNVGRPAVQQYNTLKQQVKNVDSVIIVTTAGFTEGATELADQLNIKTVDGNRLAETILEYLPEEDISTLLQTEGQTIKKRKVDSGNSAEDIPTDKLTEPERNLARIYNQFLMNFYQGNRNSALNSNHGDNYSRLRFELDDKCRKNKYSISYTSHSIEFESDSPKKHMQLLKTVEKYEWDIEYSETESTKNGGVKMFASPENADLFTIVINTGRDEEPSPKRQAKISSLILNHVFSQDLDGTTVKEYDGSGNVRYSKVI